VSCFLCRPRTVSRRAALDCGPSLEWEADSPVVLWGCRGETNDSGGGRGGQIEKAMRRGIGGHVGGPRSGLANARVAFT
jgi:hypothetical protein